MPAREFEAESRDAWQAPAAAPAAPRAVVLEADQFRARQTLEALRLGIVPVQDVETLTIGLEAERVSLDRALVRSRERGGDVLAVIGDYGFGKSHFVELAARRALRENYLVAAASLDLVEVPPGKANRDLRGARGEPALPRHATSAGLGHCCARAAATPGIAEQFAAGSPREGDCPAERGADSASRLPRAGRVRRYRVVALRPAAHADSEP